MIFTVNWYGEALHSTLLLFMLYVCLLVFVKIVTALALYVHTYIYIMRLVKYTHTRSCMINS